MNIKFFFLVAMVAALTACVTAPPSDLNNICKIFSQKPRWYKHAKDVERRWLVPVPVQMAIIHQESKFDAKAKPPRRRVLGMIPWKRPSTAYGYAQALDGTWANYKETNGSVFSARHHFSAGVDFIGWYANQAYRKAGIRRSDAYSLYLAYHEGIGGYQRRTYLRKAWLLPVARKVRARAALYAMQLKTCKSHSWF